MPDPLTTGVPCCETQLVLTNREIASAILLCVLAVFMLLIPTIREDLGDLLIRLISPRLLGLWVTYAAFSVALVAGAAGLGLWRPNMVKNTVVTVLGVGLPMLWRASDLRAGTDLLRDTAVRVLGFSALVAAYVNLDSFSVPVELAIQILATFFAVALVGAERIPNSGAFRRVAGVTLVALGAMYVLRTTAHIANDWRTEDWDTTWRVLALSVWFPVLLIPFVYACAYLMACEGILVLLPFDNDHRRPPLRVRVAVLLGLRMSVRFATEFSVANRRQIARATGFQQARRIMADYRSEARVAQRASARPPDGAGGLA